MNHIFLADLKANSPVCAGPFCNEIQTEGAGKAFSTLLGFGIQMILLIAGLLVLFFLITGAIDWLTSGGEKEKLQKAQSKITNAVIGLIIVFMSWSIWLLLVVDILHIFGEGGAIKLPSFGTPPTP